MASRVVMPKLSDTMEEGKILRWIRKEGERVETGQALAEVETDKATVEMESYTGGVMRKIVAPEGATVPVGHLIAIVAGEDEDISELLQLRSLLPICAWCKKVRDDTGYWQQIEVYVSEHSDAEFSHGICPDCGARLRTQLAQDLPSAQKPAGPGPTPASS